MGLPPLVLLCVIYREHAFCFSWLAWGWGQGEGEEEGLDHGMKSKVHPGTWSLERHDPSVCSIYLIPLAGRSKTKFSNGFPNYASDILNWV